MNNLQLVHKGRIRKRNQEFFFFFFPRRGLWVAQVVSGAELIAREESMQTPSTMPDKKTGEVRGHCRNKNKPTARTSQRNYRNRNVVFLFFLTTTNNHFNFMPITKTPVWNIFFQLRGLDQAEMKESPEGKPKTTHTAPWWLVAEWWSKPLILPVWR